MKLGLSDGGRQHSAAVIFFAALAVSLASVLGLPAGHPIRIVAGLSLFIALPGVGAELALLRPHTATSPWERLAVIGALGLAASGLAMIVLVVAGAPITEMTVGVACASIAILGSITSLIDRGPHVIRVHHLGTLRLALTLALIVSGGVVGSVIGSYDRGDYFTILAFEDPLDVGAAMQAAGAANGRTILRITVESHEAKLEKYQLSVVGGSRSETFSLQPSERRVLEVEVSRTSADSIEIQLLKSGRLYRSLRLSAR